MSSSLKGRRCAWVLTVGCLEQQEAKHSHHGVGLSLYWPSVSARHLRMSAGVAVNLRYQRSRPAQAGKNLPVPQMRRFGLPRCGGDLQRWERTFIPQEGKKSNKRGSGERRARELMIPGLAAPVLVQYSLNVLG